jgi:hypothetical protein
VALDDAGEAVALRRTGDVDVLALLEDVERDLLAGLEGGDLLGGQAQLADEPLGRGLAHLEEVAAHRLRRPAVEQGVARVGALRLLELLVGNVARRLVGKADLDGVVALLLRGLHLQHGAGARFDGGHGHGCPVLVVDLGHADLATQDALAPVHGRGPSARPVAGAPPWYLLSPIG